MGSGSGSCEIIEVEKVLKRPLKGKEVYKSDTTFTANHEVQKWPVLQEGSSGSVEDDINQLFDAIHLKVSRKILSQSLDDGISSLKKNAMKKPIRMGVSYSPGSDLSEQVSLKQALRGLCISQASEMAAMKRLSKSFTSSPRISEAGRIKSLYKAKVVEIGESSKGEGRLSKSVTSSPRVSAAGRINSLYKAKVVEADESSKGAGYMVSIQGESVQSMSDGSLQFHKELTIQSTKQRVVASPRVIIFDTHKQIGASPTPDETYPLSPQFGKRTLKEEITETSEEGNTVKMPTSIKITKKGSSANTERQPKPQNVPLSSGSGTAKKPNKVSNKPPIVVKSVFKNKIASKKKLRQESSSSAKPQRKSGANNVSNCQLVCQRCQRTLQLGDKTQAPEYLDVEVDSMDTPSRSLDKTSKQGVYQTSSKEDTAEEVVVVGKNVKSGETCEFSNSSKSSIGEFSSTTSISDDSNLSRSSCSKTSHGKGY